MSVPMISCPMCANLMPANAQYCPNCGHTNAFVAPESAVPPSTPRPDAGESSFVTPMPPPSFDAEAAAKSDDTPQGDARTINIGSSGGGASYAPPPAYSPNPMPQGQGQGQPQYMPPPAQQYGQGQTQGLQQYGGQQQQQQYPQPTAPGYGQPPPYNYQYQQQVGVAGVTQRDPNVAFLLELLGYVWFLGIGHIYGGRVARGVMLLVGYWCYWGIVLALFLTLVLSPIGCVMAILWPVVPILSGLWIKRDLERDNAMFRPQY